MKTRLGRVGDRRGRAGWPGPARVGAVGFSSRRGRGPGRWPSPIRGMSHMAPKPTPNTALPAQAPTTPVVPAPVAASGTARSTFAPLIKDWIDSSRPARRAAMNVEPNRLTRVHAVVPATVTSTGSGLLKNSRYSGETKNTGTAIAVAATVI